jgi:hypothetical protein
MAESEGGGGSGVGGDFVFFLGILLVLFAVWVGSGGPDRPISFGGPFLRPITTTGTTAQPYGDGSQYQPIEGTSWVPFIGGGTGNETSTHRELVTLSRDTTGAISSDEKKEYVIIYLSSQSPSPVSTAGWKLVSTKTNTSSPLPQGAELARSGSVNALSSIMLAPGDQAIVTSGRSPVGVSFRENMCTGYLAESQTFTPPLSLSCPSPYQELSRFGDTGNAQCSTYTRSFSQCKTKSTSDTNISGDCEDFINEYINYNGCVDAHKNESGFYSPAWRIFLGARDELWAQNRETILLIDAGGNTIDSLSY